MKLSILGTEYEVIRKNYADDPYFEAHGCNAYCDKLGKQLVICSADTHPAFADDDEVARAMCEKATLRHEIVHAFLFESGLDSSSNRITDMGWAEYEEMIDWIALQAPKLHAAFEAADAL